MRNVKRISILLLTLAGASLTACNSGAGSLSTTPEKMANVIESQGGAVTVVPRTIGVVTAGNNLDYYSDDKFTGVIYEFADKPTSVDIASVYPLIIYVSTQAGLFSLGGELKKCTVNVNNKLICKTIDQFQDVPIAIKFDELGNGYAITRANNSFINKNSITKYIQDSVVSVNTTEKIVAEDNVGGGIEVYNGELYFPNLNISKYNFDNNQVSIIDYNPNYEIKAFSLDESLTGYGVAFRELVRIANGRIMPKTLHKFEDSPYAISVVGSNIYVGTSGNELKKCDPSGSCSTIDTFKSHPISVSFKAY